MGDFISDELIELDVLGRKFKFRELKNEEMDRMLDKALMVDSNGVIKYSLSEENKIYLSAVVEAPYDEWKSLKTKEERIDFLNRLKPAIRNELIKKIKQHHTSLGGEGDAVKK